VCPEKKIQKVFSTLKIARISLRTTSQRQCVCNRFRSAHRQRNRL